MIDGLVKAIFVYDDYIKIFLTFDDTPITLPASEEFENMANSSDIGSSVSPKKEHAIRRVLFFFGGDSKETEPPPQAEVRSGEATASERSERILPRSRVRIAVNSKILTAF